MEKLSCSNSNRCYLLLITLLTLVTILLHIQLKNNSFHYKTSFFSRIAGGRYNGTSHKEIHSDYYGYPGSMELEQYAEFERRNPTFVLKLKGYPQFVKPPVDYKVTVSVICGMKSRVKCDADTVGDYRKNISKYNVIKEGRDADGCKDEGVFFSITERHGGDRQSAGGSSFWITSTTPVSRQMCTYIDMFDGTYAVWCPLSLDTNCSNMSVALDFFNFTAFSGHHKPLRDVKWRRTICRGQQSQCSEHGGVGEMDKALLRRTDLSRLQYETAMRNAVTWVRQTGGWLARLSWQRDQPFKMNRKTLCERLRHLGRLIFVGASHMRYKSDHLIIKCYSMPPDVARKHSSVVVNNIEYIQRQYATEFRTIPAELAKRNLSKVDLVLVQTGAYDMFRNGLQKSLAVAVPVFARVLRQIRDVSQKRGFRVVFVTSPSYPRNDSRSSKGSRNNFALAAFNGSLKRAVADIGFQIFDEFSAFLTYEEEAICGSHYLCRLLGDSGHVKGELGKTAAELLLAYASG
ncbi:hypothetical protein LSAT2_001460 [Lamellibrachia satsuma]|nr:hypothetical protein LSAT2_001460 [Lamellibrachia satsuma]